MRRVAVVLAGLVAAGLAGTAIGLTLQARESESPRPAAAPRASVSVVRASIQPAVHLFGQAVIAELVVVANKAIVDPDTVRVRPDFAPYAPAGEPQVERTETATSARFRYRFTLRCLDEDCAPETARQVVDFPGTAVFYRFRSTSGPGTALVDWPPFEVSARVPRDALSPERWRADVTSLPAVSYERSPGTTAVVLLASSIILALSGVGLVWWLARPEARADLAADELPEVRASVLERALQLAREASLDGDSPERRKAFERVARELGARGRVDLAERARALAWASGPARPVMIEELEREALAATDGSVA